MTTPYRSKLVQALIRFLSFEWYRRWIESPHDVDEMEELRREQAERDKEPRR